MTAHQNAGPEIRRTHAILRFGFGRRPDEPLPHDPLAWLHAQLDGPDPQITLAGPDTPTAFAAIHEYVRQPANPREPELGALFERDQAAAMAQAVRTDQPLRERLVWFWTNHFCVSARRGAWVLALIGPYVREAIRPHVTGRFGDMLRAVMHHAAMLDYLDNLWSAGPDSEYGRQHGAGINENLARECLELHTVGIDGGYSQADVASLAALLSGWSVAPLGDPSPGFRFSSKLHQPGRKHLMGLDYPDGPAGGEMALAWLGCHPATFRHLAAKLARHFIADDPPCEAVARIAASLEATGGDLGAAMRVVLDTEAAWQPLAKRRTPAEFAVAAFRALDLRPDGDPSPALVAHALGQPLWGAPLPNGWPDAASPWSSGEATLRRADWAYELAGQRPGADAAGIAAACLGPLLANATRSGVAAAASPREAVALLFASPEFQLR